MLSLDLFDSKYERELREGAVDDLEYRRMNDLREKMEILMQAYKKADTDEIKAAIMKRYNEYKTEREGYLKVREQQVPGKQDPFAYVKPEPKGIDDIQDPRQKMAQLAQRAKKGPLANVGAGLKGFLTGKEEPLDEQELGVRGAGINNIKSLQDSVGKGLSHTLYQFAGGIKLYSNEQDSDKLADYYNGLNSASQSHFVYNVIGDQAKFTALCRQLGVELLPLAAVQPDLPLNEKRSQKKKFKSALAQRELEKAMAAEPAAGDPIEAFILKSIENDQAQSQQLQDLATELQAIKSAQGPAPTPAISKPTVTATPTAAPTPTASKPPEIKPTAAPAPTDLPVPSEMPNVKDLPKKDQKILQRVKSIEKRLKNRVDQYQTARALKDTQKVATMQQQIQDLQTQLQSQTGKLSDQGQDYIDVMATEVPGRLQLARQSSGQSLGDLFTQPAQNDPVPADIVSGGEVPGGIRRAAESRIKEHGGGIGPRQHWQDLMQEGQPQELIHRYLAIDAENDVDAVRAAIQAISRDPALGANSKSRLLGQIGMIIKRHRLPLGRAYYKFMQQYMEDINETSLNPKDPQGDYEAKRRALHDLSLNKDVDQAAVLQRRLDLDREAKAKGLAETVTNVKAGMAEIYRRLAPKIERHRDSFLAGQLYDELENYAELHGAEGEFKRMMATARNSAHMEYDTNPGGFQNWFWFLPFEDQDVAEGADDVKKRMSKLEALALAANRAGDDAKCKMYQQKIQSLKQKLSKSMAEGWSDAIVSRRTGQPRTPYSVYIDGREWKAFANDDHARAVAEKVQANLKRQGREQTVTIAPSQTKRVQEDFGMPGTTIPRKSLIQGYTVFWNPKTQVVSVTRGGDSEEAAIEQARVGTPSMKNFRQAADRLIDKIESDLNEGREIQTREDFIKERDRLLRMIGIETDPANKQILKSAIRQLENRAENEGWITIQSRMVREDSDGGEAVEMAIMRRMLVAHTDLIVEFGLDKVVQAIEEVAYNVGDTDEIGSSDVSGWVHQVKQILGVDA